MARMTVRLPDSLHEVLRGRARAEGVSTNQYVVYALTQQSSLDSVVEQRARFEQLRSRFSEDEAERALQHLLSTRDAAPDT